MSAPRQAEPRERSGGYFRWGIACLVFAAAVGLSLPTLLQFPDPAQAPRAMEPASDPRRAAGATSSTAGDSGDGAGHAQAVPPGDESLDAPPGGRTDLDFEYSAYRQAAQADRDRAYVPRSPLADIPLAAPPAPTAATAPVPGAADSDPGGALHRSTEERRARVRRFGGTVATEDAVEHALRWLAAHQSPDGTWDRFNFNRRCPANDACTGAALVRTDDSLLAGVTGVALLAFLGAGYTDRDGPFPATVATAVDALLRMQRPDGGFSATRGMAGYNNAVATFALAEYHALTRDARVRLPLQRAVAHLAASQQALGGWDYLADPESGRCDTSITGWAVQALAAAKSGGIAVPPETLVRAALHLARATQPDGRIWYSDAGTGFRLDPGARPMYRFGAAMTATGLTCEHLLGWRGDAPTVARQEALLFAEPPSATLARGGDATQLHSEYYWYYGTVAMFQGGGERWERWNARLRDAILPLQDRTQRGERRAHAFGSVAPFGRNWGRWGRIGGRVYSTAIAALTLEIYYRHTPAYLDERLLLTSGDWRSFLATADEREARVAAVVLRELRYEVGELPLLHLLTHADRAVALSAAQGLAAIDSPLGRDVLERELPGAADWERSAIERALRRVREIDALPASAGRVRLFDATSGLATLELPRSYLGMIARTPREGHDAAALRVIQRFSGREVVVAEWIEPRGQPPRNGDPIVAR
ncbi:MAG: hypothetical protein AB7Q17_09350 [Phycisphaerae bacterium]